MNVTPVELLVACLATWQAIEVWQHSALTASWRARAEMVEGKLGELLRCGFCLSVWVGTAAGVVVTIPLPAATADEIAWTAGLAVSLAALLGVFVAVLTHAMEPPRYGVGDWPLVAGVAVAFVAVAVVGVTSTSASPAGLLFWGVWMGKLALLGLAIARLANLGNDLTHAWCRTPKANKLELDAAKDEAGPKNGFEKESRNEDGGDPDPGRGSPRPYRPEDDV